MARYFFHVCDGENFIDIHGTDLADLDAARREAIRFASALLADKPGSFWNSGEWRMRVASEDDLTLFELVFFAHDAPSIRIDRPF